MGMTLDKAIKSYEKIAEENEKDAEQFKRIKATEDIASYCYECAKDHRQLAKWLKELKAYKDARVGCEYCKDRYRERHERPCSLCKRNFVDMFEREVNADE